jgi:TolB-like protein/class 3 adenylate cyclase/Tfp pilus assembly protein PilF
MSSNRRLAAILFADITGYTAMMQRDEADGMRRLKRFRQVLEESVSKHGGRVLQHIGDGSLVLYDSAVEAVASAKEIQIMLQVAPKVPLRIGIHVGDIVLDDGQIYGDGVNLASRVESLGVPGSILITERVIPDLKSHPEFSAVSLGKYHLKNVSEPMEVFAVSDKGITLPSVSDLSEKPIKSATTTGSQKYWWMAAVLAFLLIVGMILWNLSRNGQPTISEIPDKSIAVLPFRDLSPDGRQAYFGDGIAEDILNALAQVEGLKVAGRTSSFSMREESENPREIGRRLGVSTILEGSIRKSGNQIRITAQLVNTESGYQMWSERYDRTLDDIFSIQDEIARAVAENLRVILMQNGVQAGTTDQQAYEWYLKGRYMLSQRSDGVESAIDFFEKALQQDPDFANAYAGLGNAYLWLGWNNYLSSKEAFPQAGYYARQALERDSSLAYAQAIKGAVSLWYEWNWEDARQELDKAIALNPGEAGAYLNKGWLYAISGEFQQGIEMVEKAVVLDPLNLEYNIDLADIHRLSRNYEQAKKIANDMQQLYPENSEVYWIKGMIHFSEKDYRAATENFRKSVRLSSEDNWSTMHLAMALGAAGEQQAADSLLTILEQRTEVAQGAMLEMVPVYWHSGKKEAALSWLEKSYQEHANWLVSLKVGPEWDEMRQETRFQDIIKAMDFPGD